MQIVFSGSIAYDYLMTFPGHFKDHILPDKLESLSLSFLVDGMSRQRGGTAPNIAFNHALLGGHAAVLGVAGDDFSDYRLWLESVGVDTRGIREITDEFTASFFANTDRSNAQIASFYPGAMAHATSVSVSDLDFQPDLVVISPNDPETMRQRVSECQKLQIPYLYDPSQQIVSLDLNDLRTGIEGAYMVVVNDYEFGLVNDKLGLDVEDVIKRGTVLVVTRGDNGSVIHAGGNRHEIGIYPTDHPRDPTGQGDAFRGGFLRGVAERWPWTLCGLVGALAATYCLEHVGTQNHSYTREEFVARFRKRFDDNGVLDLIMDLGS